MTLPLLLGLSAFTLLAVRSHKTAFFLFVGLLPTYLIRFDLFGIPTTALEILFGILFLAWLFRREKRFVDIAGWRLLVLAWLVVATVSVFVSPDIVSALGIWKAYFVEPVVFFIMANDLLRSEKDRDTVLFVFAWSAVAVGGLAVLQRWTGFAVPPPWDGTEGLRSTSFFGFPNAIGLYLAPLVPLFVGGLVRCRRVHGSLVGGRTLLLFAAVILSFAALILAESEGAQVAVLMALLIMGFTFPKSRWWTVGVAVLGAVVLLMTPSVRPAIIEKLTLEDWSGRVRKEIWVETSRMLKDRPILGAGLAGYPVAFAPYHEAGHIEIFQYPHNVILNFWSELGLGGLIVFSLIIVRFFRDAYRNGCDLKDPDPFTVSLSGAMIAILVHGLVDVPYLKNDLAFQFWIVAALVASLAAERRITTTHEDTSRAS